MFIKRKHGYPIIRQHVCICILHNEILGSLTYTQSRWLTKGGSDKKGQRDTTISRGSAKYLTTDGCLSTYTLMFHIFLKLKASNKATFQYI